MQTTVLCGHLQQMTSCTEVSVHNLSPDEQAVSMGEKYRFITTLDHIGKAVDSFAKTTLGEGHLTKA